VLGDRRILDVLDVGSASDFARCDGFAVACVAVAVEFVESACVDERGAYRTLDVSS
jgi:hypothetical protein